MTERLYELNSHLYSFSAAVTELRETDGATWVVLDRTAFFPEGGGQAGDVGSIGGTAVTDTQICKGIVLHRVVDVGGLTVGAQVDCAVDGKLRFRRMQAHSGEHIVSGLAFSLYGASNVGFHMDDLLMTVDFDRYLQKEQLRALEKKANACVWADLAVRAWRPSAQELKTLRYRSKLDSTEGLRLVSIEGIDLCACCAPHVERTGEIGLIKILSAVSHRGGVRITLVCGEAAYEDYALKYENTLLSADLLKAPHNAVPQAIEALQQKEEALRQTLRVASDKYVRQVAESVVGGEGHGLIFAPDSEGEELGRIAAAAASRFGGFCAVFSGDDRKGYRFSILYPNEKYIPFTKELLRSVNGRGGGSGLLIRGSCAAVRAQIENALSAFPVQA